MRYTKILKIPGYEVTAMQKFLDRTGRDKVRTEKTYTAQFGDKGEGDIEVDIKVCEGDPPFVDAVLFQDNSEIGVLEPDDTLVGEYVFQGFLKDTYVVIVQEMD